MKKKIEVEENKKLNIGEIHISSNGITLITLVITIIILIILAGVVINISLGENGILSRAKQAREMTKKVQIQEEIQLAVTDIITNCIIQGKDITNQTIKEQLENYTSLKGITIDDTLSGTYKGYNYYIDESYIVNIGNRENKPIVGKISINEENRLITVEVSDVIEGISKIEVINPKGDVIKKQELDKQVTQASVTCIANISGIYKVKVTNKNDEQQEKVINIKKVEISNKSELEQFREMVNNGVTFEGDTVTLLADIYLEGSSTNRNWTPIGDREESKYFSGIFEGNNHKIFDIYNRETTKRRQGLFENIIGGTIQNLGIESGHIICDAVAGGIVGRIDDGNIINCYSKAKVEGGNAEMYVGNIGGIVGVAFNTTIKECYNEGEIIGKSECNGGIIGAGLASAKILSCYNIGKIEGKSYSGGIAGYIAEEGAQIKNCYNKGNIKTSDYAGGIVGEDDEKTKVENCYSTGKVTATTGAGGVIGWHKGWLSNLFFINTAGPAWGCGVNNTDHGLEEAEGSTIDRIKQLTSKFNEGQEVAPWKEDERNINEGYPILNWQN